MAISIQPGIKGTEFVPSQLESTTLDSNSISLEVGLGPSSRVEKGSSGSGSIGAFYGWLQRSVATVLLGIAIGAMALSGGSAVAQTQQTPSTQDARQIVLSASPSVQIKAAVDRLVANDKNADGFVQVGTGRDEVTSLDPLAKAIFAYLDYVNPHGRYTAWGVTSQGDQAQGGLGVGFALRPVHTTAFGLLRNGDVVANATDIASMLQTPRSDLAATDLAAIMKAMPAGSSTQQLQAIHAAADRLIQQAMKLVEAKERATGQETAAVTAEEVIASLPAGSLERLIAETTAGHGGVFFKNEIVDIAQRTAAIDRAMEGQTFQLRKKKTADVAPVASAQLLQEAQDQYWLLISKRAQEGVLLSGIRAELTQ